MIHFWNATYIFAHLVAVSSGLFFSYLLGYSKGKRIVAEDLEKIFTLFHQDAEKDGVQ